MTAVSRVIEDPSEKVASGARAGRGVQKRLADLEHEKQLAWGP